MFIRLDIEGSQYWSSSHSSNIAFIKDMTEGCKSVGITCGFYTSEVFQYYKRTWNVVVIIPTRTFSLSGPLLLAALRILETTSSGTPTMMETRPSVTSSRLADGANPR